MRKYLLPETGNFYKANMHCHTVLSDGKRTPEEVKEIYKSLGYSVVAYTDHDILIPHDDLTDDTFLALHGFEMEVNEPGPWSSSRICCHMCFVGIDKDNITQPMWHRKYYLFGNAVNNRDLVKFDENEPDYVRKHSSEGITEIMNIAREKGFFVTYNHPCWSLENYSHYMGYNGMNALEIFNGACNSSGFLEYNPRVYDDMLRGGKKIYCVGGDDNHNYNGVESRRSDSGWAFTVIKAEKLEYNTITKALVDGNFYASEGPEIHELWYEDGKVYIKCSDADTINCTSGTRFVKIAMNEDYSPINEATFTIPEDAVYFRITVTDKSGKHACTNAYFLEDLND